MTLLSHGLPQP